MKKLLVLSLSFILLFSAVAPAAASAADGGGKAVVVIPGVMETMLQVFEPDLYDRRFYDEAGAYLRADGTIKDLIKGALLALFLNRYEPLNASLERLNDAAVGRLDMTPDGESRYDVRPVITGVENCSVAAIHAAGRWKDVDIGGQIALVFAERVGGENVFLFPYDWRLGPAELSEQLSAFIAGVKEQTGADKVDLYANSYGCQVAAQLLYQTGGAADIESVVFNAPAWRGTRLFRALITESPSELVFNTDAAADLLLRFLEKDLNVAPFTRLLPKRFVGRVMHTLIDRTVRAHLLYSPGLWSCCATEDYEEMKALLLDETKDAAFIKKIDEAQYGVMRHIPDVLAEAEANGIRTAITVNAGNKLIAGDRINGDGIVDIVSASGCEAAPVGCRLPDGRTGVHVSPDGTVDMTASFLPERTWVISGQTHGMTAWDGVTAELIPALLLGDEIETVFSDPRFPQFLDSRCPALDVSLRLAGGAEKTLIPVNGPVKAELRNDSDKTVIVTAVTVCGMPYAVTPAAGKLAPGEAKTVTLTPLTRQAAPAYGSVRISYVDVGYLPVAKSRTFGFKVG